MAMVKRVLFFVLTNIAVIATISIVTHLLGVNKWLTANGMNYEMLMGFCLIWGMGGAFISLLMSKFMAKMSTGAKVISPNTHNPEEKQIVDMVYRMSRSAGLTTMPEVAIYDSPEVNAFATGPSRSNSLVAVSTGLLRTMNKDEVEGVVGHEVAHIANGDMVTMTLIQGVVNAFVMFLARIVAYAISSSKDDKEGSGGGMNFLVVFALEIAFGILGSLVVNFFSRWREFRADQGGARYAGKERMIAALQALQKMHGHAPVEDNKAMASLKISGGGFMALFSTHPRLEDRIARLQRARI